MNVIDLSAVRAIRAVEQQAVTEATDKVIAALTSVAERYAAAAFAVSGPVRLVNEQLAVDINRSQWRRVLSITRSTARKAKPEVRRRFATLAGDAFVAKLTALIRPDDARRGLPRRDEVVGGLWVTADRNWWAPKPCPCVTTLGRLGTLAWMTHIDRTPYAMTPATRARFDAARNALQDPERWPSSAEERTVDRLIKAYWSRGWHPEEAA